MTNQADTTIDADELQRLRDENEALRSQLEGRPARSGRGRLYGAIALVVVGSLILPIAVVTAWVRTQVFSTSDYVEMVAPLAEDPDIQEAVSNRIAEYVRDEIDVQGAVEELLPTDAEALAPIIASGAVEVVRTASLEFVKTRLFFDLWVEANQLAHAVAIEVLTGRDEGVVRTESGQIYIPIGQMITEVAEQAGERLGVDLVSQLPEDVADARYVVAESQVLADAQDLLEFIDRLAWFSVVISLACLLAAVFVAPNRSRGMLWVGIGVVTATLVTRLILAWGRSEFRNGLDDAGADVDAGTAFFDIITRFLTQSLRVVFVVGLVLLLAGWLTGPGTRAAAARDWINQVTGRASERFTDPGSFSRWIAAQRSVLRTIAIALAVVVLFAWERPTVFAVILVVIVLLLVLWAISLVSRVVDNADRSAVEPASGAATTEAQAADVAASGAAASDEEPVAAGAADATAD